MALQSKYGGEERHASLGGKQEMERREGGRKGGRAQRY